MITAYRSSGEALVLPLENRLQALPEDIVWLDLYLPGKDEDSYVEQLLGMQVPTRDDLKDIEPSSRLYKDENAVYMTGSLLCRADTDIPLLTDIAFVLCGPRLVTVRYEDPRSFRLFSASMCRMPGGMKTGSAVMARLMETIIDRTAEILENAEVRGDGLLTQIFEGKDRRSRRPPRYLENLLVDVSTHHRLVSKTRDSLASLARVMTFLYALPSIQADKETRELCRSVSRDIQSLSEHASFISGNIAFLLDATLGLISVEQNAIIKIFSIASVVFLPPTLVASLYGMNFRFMPELNWSYGYPAALLIMLVSAVIPFFFFRWKGWL